MTINVHENDTQIDMFRDKYFEVGVVHHVSPITGELYKRYDFVDVLDTCLHKMRGWWTKTDWDGITIREHYGYCLLARGHKGRHTTQVFVCDACDKTRRGSPDYSDETVAFCFLCHRLPLDPHWRNHE